MAKFIKRSKGRVYNFPKGVTRYRGIFKGFRRPFKHIVKSKTKGHNMKCQRVWF